MGLNNDITKIMSHESPYSQKREESELKIYSLDCGWRGIIIVVSNSEENARTHMSKNSLYKYQDLDKELEVSEIKEGLMIDFDAG